MTSIYILPVTRHRCPACDCDAHDTVPRLRTMDRLWCPFHWENPSDQVCPACHRNEATRQPDLSID